LQRSFSSDKEWTGKGMAPASAALVDSDDPMAEVKSVIDQTSGPELYAYHADDNDDDGINLE